MNNTGPILSARGINLKSWEDIELNFHPGINMLTGHSRAGKTNFCRGMRVINENRPEGTNYISFWAVEKTKSGTDKIVDRFSFKTVLTEGSIERSRGPKGAKDNLFIVNDVPLKAVGKGVPEEVTQLLNMNEVNFGTQHGEPFLLRPDGKGGAEAARFLNKLVDFSAADEALQRVDLLSKQSKKERDRFKANTKDLEEKMEKFKDLELLQELVEDATDLEQDIDDIGAELVGICKLRDSFHKLMEDFLYYPNTDYLEELLDEGERIGPQIENLGKEIRDLSKAQETVKRCSRFLANTKDIEKAQELLRTVESLNRGIEALGSEINTLEGLKIKFNKCSEKLNNFPDLEEVEELLDDVEEITDEIKELESGIENLEQSQTKLEDLAEKLLFLDRDLEIAEEELGTICPHCNGTGRISK